MMYTTEPLDPDNFTIDQHQQCGQSLKQCQKQLEILRSNLAFHYKRSSGKEMKQLEQAIEKIRLVQVSLHGRMSIEYSEKPDNELLPVYLGRLPE